MHKSQLGGFIIDCQTDDLPAAAAFWSAALGLGSHSDATAEESAYIALDTSPDDLHIEVQKVSHPSRVHLDIETDDIEAEVARLEALGAQRLGPVRGWMVMQALGLPITHKSPLRTPQMAQGKAWPAGNGPALFKGRNAALGHLRGSLQASRWPAICRAGEAAWRGSRSE